MPTTQTTDRRTTPAPLSTCSRLRAWLGVNDIDEEALRHLAECGGPSPFSLPDKSGAD